MAIVCPIKHAVVLTEAEKRDGEASAKRMRPSPAPGPAGEAPTTGEDEGTPGLAAIREVSNKQPLKDLQFTSVDNVLDLVGLLKKEEEAKEFIPQAHCDLRNEVLFDEVLKPDLRPCNRNPYLVDPVALVGRFSVHAEAAVRVAVWVGRCEGMLDAAGGKRANVRQ